MDNKFGQYSKGTQIAIIVGIGCIIFGLFKLLELMVGIGWWGAVQQVVFTVFSYAWPIALICAGAYLVWASRTGRLKGASLKSGRPLRRSIYDKRIAGVCGGLAQFIGIDSTVIRVLAVILLVAAPVFTLVIYLLASVFIPRD